MELRTEIIFLVLGCLAVTIIPRILPMIFADKLVLHRKIRLMLRYIPIAVLSVLFFKEILLTDGELRAWDDPFFLAGCLSLAVAFIVRNIFWTVIIGLAIYLTLKTII